MKYHIWTEGCQMNDADSQRLSAALEHLGYEPTRTPEAADVIVLNTCVVRQSAENRAYGRLTSLRPLKERNPRLVVSLMGCLVGVKENPALRARFPWVDVFAPPSDPAPLLNYLSQGESRQLEIDETTRRYAYMDGDLELPRAQKGRLVSAHIPVVYGCSHACTFCIIPYRRGIERSRPSADILAEARSLAAQGVKEITLLGQIVDRYGLDLPGEPDLAGLLALLNGVESLERIRFLTSHPNYMTERILDAVASLPKVMPHIEVPCQAGDDTVLAEMKRGYTSADYAALISRIRSHFSANGLPGVSIGTDVIVGFPGETEAQFENTYRLLEELQLDVAHLARYSPRPGTVATRRMADDVPESEKMRRFRLLEALQEGIALQIHQRHLGQAVDVLFEEQVKGRWKGRTPTNKLVFVEAGRDLRGLVLPVRVEQAGAWSMQGMLV